MSVVDVVFYQDVVPLGLCLIKTIFKSRRDDILVENQFKFFQSPVGAGYFKTILITSYME